MPGIGCRLLEPDALRFIATLFTLFPPFDTQILKFIFVMIYFGLRIVIVDLGGNLHASLMLHARIFSVLHVVYLLCHKFCE